MRVLITGGQGFVAQYLAVHLRDGGHEVLTTTRSGGDGAIRLDLGTDFDLAAALAGVEVVIHAAARVHAVSDQGDANADAYRRVNEDATLRLAQQAAQAGVKHFVFLSTLKVLGEQSLPGRPLLASDSPQPQDAYSRSKARAEAALLALDTPMRLSIVRPPLVYGAGVGANFRQLLKWVQRGLPCFFAGVNNRRSLVFVGNLASLVARALEAQTVARAVYLVSDGEDVSTPELLRRISLCMGRRIAFWPIPEAVLRFLGRCLGRESAIERLTQSLAVDTSETCRALDWTPPYSLDAGLRETVAAFKEGR